jgi:hypothetical protein
MKGMLKKAAVKKIAKGAAATIFGNIFENLGSRVFSDFEGEFELKNGRRFVIKSVGTAENPMLTLSIRNEDPAERAKKIIFSIIVFILSYAFGTFIANSLFSKRRKR